jgi:hypothetical protein
MRNDKRLMGAFGVMRGELSVERVDAEAFDVSAGKASRGWAGFDGRRLREALHRGDAVDEAGALNDQHATVRGVDPRERVFVA